MIQCQVCNSGELKPRKKYRMSGPVVLIGYILLIPSILGILIGVVGLFGTGAGTSVAMESFNEDAHERLVAAGVPEAVSVQVLDSKSVPETALEELDAAQRRAVHDVESELLAKKAGTGVGAVLMGGFSFFLIISCFVGGLLGWLLIMKKKVLQCSGCGAITATS